MSENVCKETNILDSTVFWEDLRSGRFVSMVKESSKGRSVSNAREVYNVMKPLFAEKDDVEAVYCIFLDAKNSIIAIEKMFSGTIRSSAVYPREVIKRVLELKAVSLIMTHNHPSGSTTPSAEDLAITTRILFALFSIDATLHDHMIIGEGYHSLSESGWLAKEKQRCRDLI